MSENKDWLAVMESGGIWPGVKEVPTIDDDGHSIKQVTFSIRSGGVLTGHEVAQIFSDTAEALEIPNASEEDIRRSLVRIAFYDSNVMRRLRRGRHGWAYSDAQRIVSADARNLATSIRRADSTGQVNFKAKIFEKDELDEGAEDYLTELTPADWQAILSDTENGRVSQIDELRLHRSLKGSGEKRVLGRRGVMSAYLKMLSTDTRSSLTEGAVDRNFIKVKAKTAIRKPTEWRHGDTTIYLHRNDMPRLVRNDDKRWDVEAKKADPLLEYIAIGAAVPTNNDSEPTQNNLTAYLRQTQRTVRPRIEWAWPVDTLTDDTRIPVLSPPSESWDSMYMQVVSESSVLGSLILLAQQPEIAERAMRNLERDVFDRQPNPSERRRLAGLLPLILPQVQEELLKDDKVAQFEQRALSRD